MYATLTYYNTATHSALAGPRWRIGAGSASTFPATPRADDLRPIMCRDWDFLPGMKGWNRIPFYDFLFIFYFALTAAFGTIVREESTLLECAENRDSGRYDQDSDEVKRKHNVRDSILFACILNYIDPHSKVAKALKEDLLNDDEAAFPFIITFGDLNSHDTESIRLTIKNDEAIMNNEEIKFNSDLSF